MKRYLLILLFLSGCEQFTQSEIDLVTQARHGIALAKRTDDPRELMRLQRERLDRAFDEDVRARADLSADWIIEARRAYAIAMETIEKRQAAADAAEQMRARNLAAADAALVKLQTLLLMQQKFSIEEIGK